MVDKFHDPLLTPRETARHLAIPESTLYYWLAEEAGGAPLVHRVAPERRGWPSVPFVAVVEAYVLRSLRDLGLTKSKVRDAAAAVRAEFGTPYGLATRKIATDGIDIFLDYAEGDLARVGDQQRPIREVLGGYLRYITWDTEDDFAAALRLRQYPEVAPVIIDPRFSGGSPVIETNHVPVDAVVGMWLAGDSIKAVAYEYDLTPEQVESVCRVAQRVAA
ncbi:DUF433 domain-containing protein [Saccharothrix coeruleofusca]|uniref:Putative antitoxin VapB45-like DNA-binding HTH domain-containing protein n=1 Tax=Saccharothrix coeruleofusca TaxID=33919 RepID=A0A918AGN8_9PSEU|nr:DUF433 domain-containing protein [Saccharothrix coeruleofusca]MBP2340496.1 uncharacterized protein (DUF433 family) [Saccharothrix coeruleofusca]GGP35034.1 hypothetical protein GCM10010185_02230 [Saccharothrix coeruleofusca]